ncbi:LAMI_0G16754g1_1 [Lachancea mirantina]|uniref:LAMI_0G16754g1_1 n=1 Tax=Lachancea mirantina TaxID=1230905 RepID=A0A1G4KCN1_9SACH|nr:LAMI_0G16754g1_1 [Lachancea mirantina]
MPESSLDILRLPASACSAPGSDHAPTPTPSEPHGARPVPSQPQPMQQAPQAPRKPGRQFWSLFEDRCLVSAVIESRDALCISTHSRPRSRFWRRIGAHMRQAHGVHRRERQCRDRFNLLFLKAARHIPPQPTADPARRELDSLLLRCQALFSMDRNNVIVLREDGSGDVGAIGTGDGPGSGAAGVAGGVPTGVSAGQAPLKTPTNTVPGAACGGACGPTMAGAAAGGGGAPDAGLDTCGRTPLVFPHAAVGTTHATLTPDSADLSPEWRPLAHFPHPLHQQVLDLQRRVDELASALAAQRSCLDAVVAACCRPPTDSAPVSPGSAPHFAYGHPHSQPVSGLSGAFPWSVPPDRYYG